MREVQVGTIVGSRAFRLGVEAAVAGGPPYDFDATAAGCHPADDWEFERGGAFARFCQHHDVEVPSLRWGRKVSPVAIEIAWRGFLHGWIL